MGKIEDLDKIVLEMKEVVFLKKGTGQPYEAEDKALREAESERQAINKEEEERKAAFKEAKKRIGSVLKEKISIVEKLKVICEEWQKTAKDLNQAERKAEDLFEELVRIGKSIDPVFNGRNEKLPERLVHIGSQKIQWVDDEIWPLTEDFRRELILDNRDFVLSKKGPRPGRPKVKTEKNFDPLRVEVYREYGIPIPQWMMDQYLKYQEKVKQAVATK